MRFHLDISPFHLATAPTGSASACPTGRTGLRLPVIALMGDGNAIFALARGGMR